MSFSLSDLALATIAITLHPDPAIRNRHHTVKGVMPVPADPAQVQPRAVMHTHGRPMHAPGFLTLTPQCIPRPLADFFPD